MTTSNYPALRLLAVWIGTLAMIVSAIPASAVSNGQIFNNTNRVWVMNTDG